MKKELTQKEKIDKEELRNELLRIKTIQKKKQDRKQGENQQEEKASFDLNVLINMGVILGLTDVAGSSTLFAIGNGPLTSFSSRSRWLKGPYHPCKVQRHYHKCIYLNNENDFNCICGSINHAISETYIDGKLYFNLKCFKCENESMTSNIRCCYENDRNYENQSKNSDNIIWLSYKTYDPGYPIDNSKLKINWYDQDG